MEGFDYFNWVVLPVLIFAARALDVSIGTIRIIFISKGRKILAPMLGFIEILIWLFAVRQVLINMPNPACLVGFAAGFAMGNYFGIIIEEKLAIGVVVVRVITQKDASSLFGNLLKKGYRVTDIQGQGAMGAVDVIFTIVQRSELQEVIATIMKFNPKAFFTIEDIRSVNEQYLVRKGSPLKDKFL